MKFLSPPPHSRLRCFTALFLVLLLLLSLAPTAFADSTNACAEPCTHEAAIGSTHYDTLTEALKAATPGAVIDLLGKEVSLSIEDTAITLADVTIQNGVLNLIDNGAGTRTNTTPMLFINKVRFSKLKVNVDSYKAYALFYLTGSFEIFQSTITVKTTPASGAQNTFYSDVAENKLTIDNSIISIDGADRGIVNSDVELKNQSIFSIANCSIAMNSASMTVSDSNVKIQNARAHGYTNGTLTMKSGSSIEVDSVAFLGINCGNGSIFEDGSNISVSNCCTTPDISSRYYGQDIAISTNGDLTIKSGASVDCDGTLYAWTNGNVTIGDGNYKNVVEADGKEAISISGGSFDTDVSAFVDEGKTLAKVYQTNASTYLVGEASDVASKIQRLSSLSSVEVLQGDLTLSGLPGGVSVSNKGGGTVTANGQTIPEDESLQIPHPKPIAGVVVSGGEEEQPGGEEAGSQETAPTYAVICRKLNVRSGPGTSYDRIGSLSRGALLSGVLEDGWLRFTYNGQTAYVSATYVQKLNGSGDLCVLCNALNVRTGPSTSYAKLGQLLSGTYVDPLESQNGWYKIGYNGGYGWICADYVG